MRKSFILVGVLIGIVVTLATWFIETPGLGPLVGAVNYGVPLPWRSVVVYPGSPTLIDYSNLAIDLVFWVVVFVIVALVANRLVKKIGSSASWKCSANNLKK
ncbi:MAG: hypothetical protein FJZ49_00810 [Candidatus Verstraetearchaeota archaeon]|nr:hypothetical protein [Candidatus Verstraetearchaeota archaeon]